MDILSVNNINVIKTKKFKTITIKLVLVNEFSKEKATKYSLLTKVLTNTSKKYNTKRKVTNKLFDLYDASIYIGTTPLHKTNLMHFTLKVVNEKYINEEGLLDKTFDFLYQFVCRPNVINNKFDEHVFNEEKRQLKDEIKKVYNNKNRYAMRQAIKNMCTNEIVSVSALGDLEDLNEVTAESLYEEYLNLISTSKALFYIIGDVDDSIVNKFKRFKKIGKDYDGRKFELYPQEDVKVDKVNEVIEKQEINQAKLVLGFRTKTTHIDEDHHVMQLFSMMYGGLFCSNLFMNVRENNSLAYDISSQVVNDEKMLIVFAGIDSENYKKTVDIILEELNKYKTGDIDIELLETAKVNAISEIQETEDYPGEYISFLLKQDLLNLKSNIYDEIEKIKKVTIDDIKNKACEVELDTIFLLSDK